MKRIYIFLLMFLVVVFSFNASEVFAQDRNMVSVVSLSITSGDRNRDGNLQIVDGEQKSITFRVKNNNPQDFPAIFSIGYEIFFSSGDQEQRIFDGVIQNLQPQEERDITTASHIFNILGNNPHNLLVKLDNRPTAAMLIYMCRPVDASIVSQDINVPQIRRNERGSVRFTARNLGNQPIENLEYKVFFMYEGANPIVSGTIPQIPAGGSQEVVTEEIDLGNSPGAGYHVTVMLDPNFRIDEIREDNNRAESAYVSYQIERAASVEISEPITISNSSPIINMPEITPTVEFTIQNSTNDSATVNPEVWIDACKVRDDLRTFNPLGLISIPRDGRVTVRCTLSNAVFPQAKQYRIKAKIVDQGGFYVDESRDLLVTAVAVQPLLLKPSAPKKIIPRKIIPKKAE